MKKIIFLLIIISLFLPIKVLALAPTNITATLKETKQLKVQNQDFPFPPEITPLTLMQPNGQRLYVLSTQWSFLCTSPDNILNSSPTSPLVLSSQNCQLVTKPDVYDSYDPNNTNSSVKMRFKNPEIINPITQMTKDWKRTYDGLLSLHLINNQLVGVRHNEHVNHEYPADWTGEGKAFIYQNTIQTGVPAIIPSGGTPYIDAVYKYSWPRGCRSGYNIEHYDANGIRIDKSGLYDQCWDSFQNFVSLVQIDYPIGGWTAKPNIKNPDIDNSIHDQGPIIWPDSNYRGSYDGLGNMISPANHWRSSGFYQPTSFVNNDYIYTFFKTVKYGGYCTGAARAPLSSNGTAGSWKFFNRARNTFDVPSLPNGFTKETIRNYYDTITGNKSDCIVDESDTSQPQYFNVAKIKNTPYFIAAEERSYQSNGKWAMGVRFSTDLINWSSLQELSSCQAATGGTYIGWGCGSFAYPTFLDKNATTNYEIDKDEFYILGTHATATSGYELNAIKLSLTLKPPVDKIDSLIRQYFQQFLKRDSSSLSWHQDIMNQSGCKGVIRDFINSPEFTQGLKTSTTNENYITVLYRAILSRNPDQNGITWYLNKLNSGISRDAITEEIINGQEADDACLAGKLLNIPGDIDNNSRVNILDLRQMISNIFNLYSIFDYNKLVENFGK